MPALELVVAVLLGYFLGAIPSGVLVGRLRGVDPRSTGSGRTGTTNALRSLGPRWAAVVALLDLGKGILAVVLGGLLGPDAWGGALAGVGAVVGHVWSIFIGFRGGRGVATGGGAMLVLAPLAVLASLPEFAAIVAATRYVSLGSISAAITVAIVAGGLYAVGWVGIEAVVAAVLIGLVVVVAHADNIGRLLSGTERRLGDG
jgi:acyl phosphate:glycerol-3-phosphate acyltransferase